jgi:ribosome-interacting GTPase 1
MANNKVHSPFDLLSDEELLNALLSTKDNNDFIILLSQLETRNIRRFMNVLEEFLVSKDIKQNAKTIILELLKSQDVNKVVKVRNKENIIDVDLKEMKNVLDQEEINLILTKINEIENNDDPNYLLYAQDVLFSYSGYIYPELLNNKNINDVSCAISLYVDSLFNNEEDFENKVNIYSASLNEVNKIFDEISDSMLY